VWDQDDNEPFQTAKAPANTHSKSKNRSIPRSKRATPAAQTITTNDTHHHDTSMVKSLAEDDLVLVEEINPNVERSFFHPTTGFMSRGHLTCGVAPGVSAAQAGLDMIEMIRQEAVAIRSHRSLVEKEDEHCVMRFFDHGSAIVYLKDPIEISTIFSGLFH
jgi:hypothetical protein